MKNTAKSSAALLILVVILILAACFLFARNIRCANLAGLNGLSAGWDAKKQLDFAETLANKGLKKEALIAFDDYLKIARISAMESAKLLYRMGNMYMELPDYQKAVYYFYKAEAADPNAGFKSQLDAKLVACLQNLGMTTQAQHELEERTSLDSAVKKSVSGTVVAKVGDEEITDTEINEAINAIPEWARENFMHGEGRVEFVRQYATTQALYKKAMRTGLEQDEDVQRNIRDVTKKLLVQKFLENQLKDKVSVDPSDIETFYEANKDKYKQPPAASLSMIKITDEKKAQDALHKLEAGADFAKMAADISEDESTKAGGGLLKFDIEKETEIPGAGFSKEASEAVFSKKEGEIAGPVKIKDAYYVFKINKLNPEKQLTFEEVRDQAEYEYKNKKVQEQMQAFLKNILQEQQVEVYADRILGKEAPQAQAAPQDEAKPQDKKK